MNSIEPVLPQEPDFIVRVLCADDEEDNEALRFLGSGFFVAGDLIVTCAHIFKERDYETHLNFETTPLYVLPQGVKEPIIASVRALDRERDLAVLELDFPLETHVPILLTNVTNQYENFLSPTEFRSIVCKFVGFTISNRGQKYWEQLLKFKGPDFEEGVLRGIRVDGGVERGGSGAPVFMWSVQRNLCIGVACISGKQAPTTFIISSDTVMDFLNKNGISISKKVDASIAFPIEQIPQIRDTSGLPKTPKTILPSHKPTKLNYRFGALIGIGLILSSIAIWGYWSEKKSTSENLTKENTETISQYRLVPVEYQLKQRAGLNVLVLSFQGSDQSSVSEGYNRGLLLKDQIEAYKKIQENTPLWQEAHLKAEGLHIDFDKQPVSNQAEARSIGLARQADLIIWGSITFQTMGSHKKYSITPYVTSIKWNTLDSSLDTTNQNGLQLRLPKDLAQVLDIMMAIYAYDRQRYTVAAQYFKTSISAITETEESWRLLLVAADSLYKVKEQKSTDAANSILDKVKINCAANDDCLGHYWVAIAEQQHRQENGQDALKTYEMNALPLIEKLHETSLHVNTLMNIAELREAKGDETEAISLANKALALTASLPTAASNRLGSQVSGWLELRKGNIKGAIANYEHLLTLVDPVNEIEKKGIILGELAKAYYASGDVDKADRNFKDSLAVWIKVNSPKKQAYIRALLGTMWFEKHDYEKSIHFLQPAAEAFHGLQQANDEARVLGRLAVCYLNTQQKDKLHEAIVRVTPLMGTLSNSHFDAATYESLAAAFDSSKNSIQAVSMMDRSLEILLKENHNNKVLAYLYAKKATYEVRAQKKLAAADSYRQAAQHFRKQADLLEAAFAMDAACDFFVQGGKPTECNPFLLELEKLGSVQPVGLLEQARMLTRMGKRTEALALYNKALEIIRPVKPSDREFFQTIIRSNIARISNWSSFEGCMGVVLTNFPETTTTVQSGSLQPGDVIVELDNRCASSVLFMRDILMPSLVGTKKIKKAKIWRNGVWLTHAFADGKYSVL